MQIFLLEHLKTQRNWRHFPCIDRFDWLSDGVSVVVVVVFRSRKHRASRVHHHPGGRGLPRPHRSEDLLHHPVQAGGAVGWETTTSACRAVCLFVSLFFTLCPLMEPAGGKDGMVGFPDFTYKHIVPACFLAPLKPTFDLSDAQTVLVSSRTRVQPKNSTFWQLIDRMIYFQTLSECALTLKMIHLKRVKLFDLTKVKNPVEFWNVSRYLEKCLVWCFVSGAGVHPVLTAGVFTLPAGGARDLTGIWPPLVENVMFMLSYYRTGKILTQTKKTRYIVFVEVTEDVSYYL